MPDSYVDLHVVATHPQDLSKIKQNADCLIFTKGQGSCVPASYYAKAQKEEQSGGKIGDRVRKIGNKKKRNLYFQYLKSSLGFPCTPTNQIIHIQLQVLFPKWNSVRDAEWIY